MHPNVLIRPAQPGDELVLFDLINALADYEKLTHHVTGNADTLRTHLFGDRSCIEAALAEWDGKVVGFALFFTTYSTFLTQPRLYLEDLFVLPDYRGHGIGKALLAYLATVAIDRECGALNWSVLDWNQPAIAFYERMGATISQTARICRLTADQLSYTIQQVPIQQAPIQQIPIQQIPENRLPTLRPATASDASHIFSLAKALAECDGSLSAFVGNVDALTTHLFGDRPYAKAVVAELVAEHPAEHVAEQDGQHGTQIVGFAVFYGTYSTFLTQPGLFIEDLFVLPNHRGNGIGKALLGYLAQHALEQHCGRLEWLVRDWNQPAIDFYQRMGATVLPDWRMCQVSGDAIASLTHSVNTL